MTHDEAASLVCSRCRAGEKAIHLPGSAYFYHGNIFMRCDASPIHADKETS